MILNTTDFLNFETNVFSFLQHFRQNDFIDFFFIVLDPCPTYYTLLRDSCYLIDQNQTWSRDDAQAHCDIRGGHLVDLETEQEVEVIRIWINSMSMLTTVVKLPNSICLYYSD